MQTSCMSERSVTRMVPTINAEYSNLSMGERTGRKALTWDLKSEFLISLWLREHRRSCLPGLGKCSVRHGVLMLLSMVRVVGYTVRSMLEKHGCVWQEMVCPKVIGDVSG